MRKQSDGVHSSSQLITVIDMSATGWEKEILFQYCIKWGGGIHRQLTEGFYLKEYQRCSTTEMGFLKGGNQFYF